MMSQHDKQPSGRPSESAAPADEAATRDAEFDSAIHGLVLYFMALAVSLASLSVHADTGGAQDKRSAAARDYVVLHMQQYTGLCTDTDTVAASRGRPSVCLYEDWPVGGKTPAGAPRSQLRASVTSQGVR